MARALVLCSESIKDHVETWSFSIPSSGGRASRLQIATGRVWIHYAEKYPICLVRAVPISPFVGRSSVSKLMKAPWLAKEVGGALRSTVGSLVAG